MIRVEYHSDGTYILRLDTPEAVVVSKIAIAYSIPKEAAVAAIINRGMDSISKHMIDIADKATKERNDKADG